MRSGGACAIASSQSASASGAIWSRSHTAKSSTTCSCSAVAAASSAAASSVAELVQHVVELVAGQRADGRVEVALGEQRVGAAQPAAAPQLGAERATGG